MDIVASKVVTSLNKMTAAPIHGTMLGDKLFGIYRSSLYMHGVYATDTDDCVTRDDVINAYQLKPHKMQALMPSDKDWWGSKEQEIFLRVLAALLDFKSHPYALVILCPGPWSKRDTQRLQESKHDATTFVAECIKIGCKWCKKWRSTLKDVPSKVAARIASNSIGIFTTTASIKRKLASVKNTPKINLSRQSCTIPPPATTSQHKPSPTSSV